MPQHFIKYTFLFSLLFVRQIFSQTPSEINLDDVVKIAIKHNHDMKISRNEYEAAKNDATLANAGLLPNIDISGSYARSIMDTKTEFTGGLPSSNVPGAETKMYSAKVEISRTVFDGFYSINKYSQLKKQAALSNVGLKSTLSNTIASVWKAWFNLVSARNDYQISKETYLISKERLKKIDRELHFGQGKETEKLNAMSAVNADTLQVIRAYHTMLQTLDDLNVLLGLDTLKQEMTYSPVIELTHLDQTTLHSNLLKNNVSLHQAKLNSEVAEFSYSMSKANYYPRVSLSAGYGYDKQDYDAGIMSFNETSGFSIGVMLSYTLFDWGKTKNDVQKARLNVVNSRSSLEKTNMQIEKDFEQAWRDYQLQLTVIGLEEKNLEIEKDRFKRIEMHYYLGQNSNLEFRDAQLSLARSRNKFMDAKIDAKFAELELLKMTGLLIRNTKHKND
ncbi:MAG: TolC family protein [Deferribacteres bacterium]|nr:TolC family protein [Deferribacteres bacterium]